MPSAVISVTSSGANTLVAAVPGFRITVTGYVLISAGTVDVTFKSSTTTNLSGAMPLTAQAGASAPLAWSFGRREGWFTTAVGELLNLNLSAAVGVYGHLTYELIP